MTSTNPTPSAAKLVASIDQVREFERKLEVAGPAGHAAAAFLENGMRGYVATASGSKTFVDDLDRTRRAAQIYAMGSPLTGGLARPVADATFIAYQDVAIGLRKPKP